MGEYGTCEVQFSGDCDKLNHFRIFDKLKDVLNNWIFDKKLIFAAHPAHLLK